MSFGFAVGDFIALGKLAWGLYKQCKGASAEFADICNEVLSIHIALRELEDEARNEDSILNRAGKGRQKELNSIIQNCTDVLRQLESLVKKYSSLGTSQKKVWDRVKFGDEGIQIIRNKLVLHTSTLTLFLTSLGTGSLGRIEKKLDEIAAEIRAGQHEPSVITAVNDDVGSSQSEAWSFLFKELAEDFSRAEIEAYKVEIKSYIKQLVENGGLEEQAGSDHSDEAITNYSTTHPSSPFMSAFQSRHSSGGTAELRRWPPKPAVESGPESDDAVDQTKPSQPQLQPGARHTDTAAKEAPNPILARSTGHNSPTIIGRGSLIGSNSVRTAGYRAELASLVESNGTDTEKLGPGCKIGIEIGTDCCGLAAYESSLRKPVCIPDEFGCVDIPTCVAFTEGEVLVGTAAKRQAATNLENTFSGFTCLTHEKTIHWTGPELNYKSDECDGLRKKGTELMIFVPCRKRHYTLVDLVALLIRHCLSLAEAWLGRSSAFFSTTLSSRLSAMDTIAEAAEAAGISSPDFVSSYAALASYIATQRPQESQSKVNIMVVEVGSRCTSLAFVKTVAVPQEPPTLDVHSFEDSSYGSSIDQIYAHKQLLEFRMLEPFHGLPWYGLKRKQAGIVIEGVRNSLIERGEHSRHIPLVYNDTGLVLQYATVELSRIVPKLYLDNLRTQLEGLLKIDGVPHVCIMAGELARLDTLQSVVKGLLIGTKCDFVLGTSEVGFSAAKGAVLLNKSIRDYDSGLELLVRGSGGEDEYLELARDLLYGRDFAPETIKVPLHPAFASQNGVFLAVYRSFDENPKIRSRAPLFEVAFQPFGIWPTYILQICLHRNHDIGFQLRRYSSGRGEYEVEADIQYSRLGIVDLKAGPFIPITSAVRKEWRLQKHERVDHPKAPWKSKVRGAKVDMGSGGLKGANSSLWHAYSMKMRCVLLDRDSYCFGIRTDRWQ